jgi:hypothetical protein
MPKLKHFTDRSMLKRTKRKGYNAINYGDNQEYIQYI